MDRIWQNQKPLRVLVAPLNWGLGHATRCMPIIDAFLQKGAKVYLASDGRAFHLLQKEYPNLPTFRLPSYNIRYNGNSNNLSFAWMMARQIPKILQAIKLEQQAVQKIVRQHQIDLILSDNRYGCWTTETYNIILTHQIFIPLPPFMRWLEPVLLRWNRQLIYRFHQCWIPDYPDAVYNLSGRLTHLQPLTAQRFQFIGPLSRFSPHIKKTGKYTTVQLLVILSGPEPQRTLFEQQIIKQLQNWQNAPTTLLVRGITENENNKQLNSRIWMTNYLTAQALNEAILEAKVVVSRAGYSTLMDLVKLRKPAILVPTPNQTEQEYLANYVQQRQLFYTCTQANFQLQEAFQQIVNYNIPTYKQSDDLLENAITNFFSENDYK